MSSQLLPKTLNARRTLLIVLALAVTSAAATSFVVTQSLSRWQTGDQRSAAHSSQAATNAVEVEAVSALGRLEPQGEVIQISAPTLIEGSRVEQLLVKQGDRVREGQVIAILDNRDRLQAALETARQQVIIAEARLAQVQAGAKTGLIQAQGSTVERTAAELRGEVAAQDAAIARLQAEVANAELEQRRYQQLYQDGAVSASQRDSKQLTLETVRERSREAKVTRIKTQQTLQDQLSEARANLNAIVEVRPTDVQFAQAELGSAKAAVAQAQANLDQAYIRAPRSGQVLKIYTFPGEIVGTQGIVALGQTKQMYVVAEVYETDVSRIRPDQSATVTSRGFAAPLQGKVDEIGLQVAKKDVLNTDPTADVDARVVEVKIRLDPADSQKVAGLTNLQVNAIIQVKP